MWEKLRDLWRFSVQASRKPRIRLFLNRFHLGLSLVIIIIIIIVILLVIFLLVLPRLSPPLISRPHREASHPATAGDLVW